MNWKRGLGIALLFIGLGFSFASKTITGNVIGFSPFNFLGFFGILSFIAGLIVLYSVNLEEIAEGEKVDEDRNQAHNAINYEKLKNIFRFAEAHGVKPEDIHGKKAWVTMYHSYSRGKNPDFSKGLKKEKSSRGGFYFCPTAEESIQALADMGFNRADIDTMPVKISKNVYNPYDKRGIVKYAPSPQGDYYYIPSNRFKKANELIKKGLIKLG